MTDEKPIVENGASADIPICGLIMPISATTNHSSDHWRKVRTLLSRAIENAGFQAVPVWENVANDRVSERIIGNIFKFPMVITDISDLNPNVMLELGMRLASKKPTIAVVNEGGVIPFDIRDFHVAHYPSTLSILEMEEFIELLSQNISDLYISSRSENYTPFLGNVVVDVISPSEREVSTNKFVLDRLDSIERKLTVRQPYLEENRFIMNAGVGRTGMLQIRNETLLFVEFASDESKNSLGWFSREISSVDPSFDHFSAVGDADGTNRYAVVINSRPNGPALNSLLARIKDMCIRANATFGISADQVKAFWLNF